MNVTQAGGEWLVRAGWPAELFKFKTPECRPLVGWHPRPPPDTGSSPRSALASPPLSPGCDAFVDNERIFDSFRSKPSALALLGVLVINKKLMTSTIVDYSMTKPWLQALTFPWLFLDQNPCSQQYGKSGTTQILGNLETAFMLSSLLKHIQGLFYVLS